MGSFQAVASRAVTVTLLAVLTDDVLCARVFYTLFTLEQRAKACAYRASRRRTAARTLTSRCAHMLTGIPSAPASASLRLT